jgi:hypothetical protein
MTDAEGANQPVAPDSRMIASFAKVLFDYSEGWVAVRAFPEKGDASQPPRTPFVAADAELPTKLVAEAEAAAKKGLALYVVAGTVSGPGKAKAGDIIAIEAVLVDLDHGDVFGKARASGEAPRAALARSGLRWRHCGRTTAPPPLLEAE